MNFKLPSISRIAQGLEAAIRRFPVAMLAAAAATTVGLLLVNLDEPGIFPSILLVLTLAFPLFVSIKLLAEQRNWSWRQLWLWRSGALIFLAFYYWLLPANLFEAEQMFIIRYLLWAIGFILLLTFVSFLVKGDEKTIKVFWHYNLNLVLAVALTAVWAAAIWAGIAIAMGSVDFLFNIDIPGERYLELWILILGIFSTAFFLSRLPKSIHEYDNQENYPNELRLFSQYVLVPLVALYFLILYAYVVRILVLWEWPEGTLAYMILGFSLLGVLTYVSLYPLREKVNWIRKAGTAYFIALIPQVGMLFWALWFRISEYAFTENRYFVLVFGAWLLVMALYFLISQRKDIRIIPITIFAIALLSSFGPWGAFSVSERSQINRLERLLVKNEILVNGRVRVAEKEVTTDDTREISAIVRYLDQVHGLEGIQPWFEQDFSELEVPGDMTSEPYSPYNLRPYDLPSLIVQDLFGLDYIEVWERTLIDDEYFSLNADFRPQGQLLDLSGYDYLAQVYGYDSAPGLKPAMPVVPPANELGLIGDDEYTYSFAADEQALVIRRSAAVIASVGLTDLVEPLVQTELMYGVASDKLTKVFSNDEISLKLIFSNISGTIENSVPKINSFDARMLFTLQP